MRFGLWLTNPVRNALVLGCCIPLLFVVGCGLIGFDGGGSSGSGVSAEVVDWQRDFNESMANDLRVLLGKGLAPAELEAKIKEASDRNRKAATDREGGIADQVAESVKVDVDQTIRDLITGYETAAKRL